MSNIETLKTVDWVTKKTLSYNEKYDRYSINEIDDIDDAHDRRFHRRSIGKLLHCEGFRKLKETKQVYSNPSPKVRDRLTHSLEVKDIATQILIHFISSLKESLKINMDMDLQHDLFDILEFSCLSHDIGHPPYAHATEKYLNETLPKRFFDSNVQNLRILCGQFSPSGDIFSKNTSISCIDASIKKKHHGLMSSNKYRPRECKIIEYISKENGTLIDLKKLEDINTTPNNIDELIVLD